MLVRTAIFAAVAAVLATQIPSMLELAQKDLSTPAAPGSAVVPATASPSASAAQQAQQASLPSGRVRIDGDRLGHFQASFRINGKPMDGVIDTGASTIAINETAARRLGFTGNGLDFRYTVNTANGGTEAAHVILDRVEIGSIRVTDVDAFVLRDKALSGMLVGMTFLKKLKSYQVADGQMTLAQ
ncbi:MAG: TIGR02281 family clan AA aspartic protease [Neorhizobium sp.]|nr:TIGR02281 family clan AA aspartic protease [Neorhizobium sp.]